ncbi:hypothetical protein N7450_006160 [Penicillium hetheringtonii]|uniref:Zn(2)-C6 fungal-type domain-containing protein n=1 Tax=Penicillium hetheringtonii TaxID=911720 RepID=A0AAD6GQS1_9EURO|nr:hypothetical protein N7450_006160 [Penicillium hetheringtonii]
MADTNPRKRSRAACVSCQSRKRKCSGDQPCTSCARSGISCQFNLTPRKKPNRVSRGNLSASEDHQLPENWQKAQSNPTSSIGDGVASVASPISYTRSNDVRPTESRPNDLSNSLRLGSRSLEANSGASFVRKLGLRIDPARAPRLHLFAWNVGERKQSPDRALSGTAAPITNILSQAQMLGLAAIYFEKIHPCYAFLDRETLLSRIVQTWSNKGSAESNESFEAVLCGIAALAYLFSQREIMDIETKLAEDARVILEKSVLCGKTPSIDTITGWVLRTAYLRMTASPHAAWMASCTLMHLIEAAGLHLEASDTAPIGLKPCWPKQDQPKWLLTIPIRSRYSSTPFWHGAALEYLDIIRSRQITGSTSWSNIGTANRSTRLHGEEKDLFHLLPLSESLDPTGPSPQDLPDLETALTSVLNPINPGPSLILVQCNLMLCIYRRARALNPNAPLRADLQDKILALASRALVAARKMVASLCPWHQVANVPFQVVCTLLAIDSRAALGLLPDAMQTLREVQAAYDTSVMREAYSTAYLLVALHQRRKEDDTRALAEVLRANASAAGDVNHDVNGPERDDMSRSFPSGISAQQGVSPASQITSSLQLQQDAADADFAWLGDLMIDMPSLQNFDLEQFLGTTVPWPLPEMGI